MMHAHELRGQWNELRGKVKQKWGQLTDDDVKIAEGGIEQVIGRIERKTGESRKAIEDFLESLHEGGASMAGRAVETAKEYVQQAADTARQGVAMVGEQARRGYEGAGEMVQRHPTQSMFGAFAIGLLTGVVVGLAIRPDRG